jgi:hypothetical protein
MYPAPLILAIVTLPNERAEADLAGGRALWKRW